MKHAGHKSVKEELPERRKGPKRAAECRLKVPTHVWEQDAAGSNPVTRTTFLRKAACLGGFSSFFVLLFVFKAIAVQRWFQGKKSDWSMSKDSR